jgi:hypothetical protein
MTLITLNQGEKLTASLVGKSRENINQHKGVVDQKVSTRDSEWQNAKAIGAELAFCRLVNVYPDLSVLKPGEHDCVFAGATWDVKYIEDPAHNLIVSLSKKDERKRSDFYVVMLAMWENFMEPAEFRYLGYATAKMVFENINHNLPEPAYFVKQGRLIQGLPRG